MPPIVPLALCPDWRDVQCHSGAACVNCHGVRHFTLVKRIQLTLPVVVCDEDSVAEELHYLSEKAHRSPAKLKFRVRCGTMAKPATNFDFTKELSEVRAPRGIKPKPVNVLR